MTENKLNEIEARTKTRRTANSELGQCFFLAAREDIFRLIAEVRQLRAERDVLIHYIINQHNDCPCSMGENYCQKPDTRDYCDGGFYGDLDVECYEEFSDCWLEWARKSVLNGSI